MKRRIPLLLTLLLTCLQSVNAGEKESYAVFKDGTLSFYYDENRNNREGTIYSNKNDISHFSEIPWNDNKGFITNAIFDESFANARPKTTSYWFSDCENLTEIQGMQYLNTSNVEDMRGMFYQCIALNSLDVSHLNTSSVTDMSEMFSGCNILTTLDVSSFNTCNVTDMGGMFEGCNALTSLDVSHFDTSNVISMGVMFADCHSLTDLDVSHFNTSNVTSMALMFASCEGLTNLDVSHFDTKNVTNMNNMFAGCNSLTGLDVSHFNTTNVTNMSWMFESCSGLTKLDVSNFDTSNATDVSCMFSYCSGLTSLDVTHFDTSNVTNMSNLFRACSSLTNLDVSHFNTSKVLRMDGMFAGCSSLTSLDVSSFDTGNVTNMGSTTSMMGMFAGCSSLTSLDLSNFNTSNVTSMDCMFYECSSLTSLNLSSFDTSNVTNMAMMFGHCSNLTNINLSSFNTSKVTHFDNMFNGCSSLKELDLHHFITNNAANMGYMFYHCSSLTSLDITLFSTSNAIKMNEIFSGCSSLSCIVIPENMLFLGGWPFSNCKSLKTIVCLPKELVVLERGFSGCPKELRVFVRSYLTNTYKADPEWGKRNIVSYTPGDANVDEKINVLDAVEDVNFILEQPTEQFFFWGGDANENNIVDISDVNAIIDMILTPDAKARMSVNSTSTDMDNLTLTEDADNRLTLHLQNHADYSAFQLEVNLPNSAELKDLMLSESRCNDHKLKYRHKADGNYIVVVYSLGKEAFTDNSGELLSFTTDATDVTIEKIHFVTTDNRDKWFNKLNIVRQTTGISTVSTEYDKSAYYNLNGLRVQPVRCGLYIKNNKKIVVK